MLLLGVVVVFLGVLVDSRILRSAGVAVAGVCLVFVCLFPLRFLSFRLRIEEDAFVLPRFLRRAQRIPFQDCSFVRHAMPEGREMLVVSSPTSDTSLTLTPELTDFEELRLLVAQRVAERSADTQTSEDLDAELAMGVVFAQSLGVRLLFFLASGVGFGVRDTGRVRRFAVTSPLWIRPGHGLECPLFPTMEPSACPQLLT